MQVQLGNPAPKRSFAPHDGAPRVTYFQIPDAYQLDGLEGEEFECWGYDPTFDVAAAKQHIVDSHSPYRPVDQQGITRFSDLGHGHQEAYLALIHPSGGWMQEAQADPTWVWCDKPDYGEMLARHWGIPQLDDDQLMGVHDTHWTQVGYTSLPPGVNPNSLTGLVMTISNDGRVMQANMMGGGTVTPITGTGSSATATTLATSLSTSSTTQYTGARVYVFNGTAMVFGVIQSCTSGANATLTVDRWYNPTSPGGSPGTTPASGYYFCIPDGGTPSAWFMGLTTTAYGAVTDHCLPGTEYYVAGGGLSRKICTFAITSSVSPVGWTEVCAYTVNSNDAGLPKSFVTIGTFTSQPQTAAPATGGMLSESTIPSATLSSVGDQLTVTDTWAGS